MLLGTLLWHQYGEQLTPRRRVQYNVSMLVRSSTKQSHAPRPPLGSAEVRAHNTSVILSEVWRKAPLSRADLARITGLSRSTVSAIAGDLVADRVLLESQGPIGRTGRPPIALRIAPDRVHFLGIEMGNTGVELVRVNLVGEVLARHNRALSVETDPKGTLAAIGDLVQLVSSSVPVAGVGLAVPSPLDPNRPGMLSENILPAWRGVRVVDALSEALRAPVFLGNDANLGALAEHWWGAGRGVDDFAYVKVDTGVGAGLFMGGRIYGGAAGTSGEIGHTAIDPETGPLCRCGRTGCLEARIGSGALLRSAKMALGDDAPESTTDLVQLALGGDPGSAALVEDAGRYIGIALANLVNLLNPDLVILDSVLTHAGDLLFEPLRAALHERALSACLDPSRVVSSELGREAVALGGATLVLNNVLNSPHLLREALA